MPGARLPARRRAVSRWIAAVVAGIALIAGPLVAVPAAVAAPVTYAKSAHVPTADLTKFQPGNIISDATFFDRGTMTEAQIQSFLEARVPNCQSGYTCLKDWYDTSRTTTADAMCGAYSGGVRERASRIIYKVAQACGINPQVILATLEKEQGLVRHTWPSEWRYTIAMGQGCPDTAACDTRYYGFFNQVYGAAWQFKRYANPAGTSQYFTWYAPGKTWNVRYNPNESCGSSPVYIQNQATANLYYYTPYQPNAAALRAGYGTGDGCSAYGNRNFYNFFTDWFGSTQTITSGLISQAGNVFVISGANRYGIGPSLLAEYSRVFGQPVNVSSERLGQWTHRGKAGAVIRNASTGQVAMLQGGQSHWFGSCALVSAWGGACNSSEVILTAEDYNRIPVGERMTWYARQEAGGAVYLIEGQSLVPVYDSATATTLNNGVSPYAAVMDASLSGRYAVSSTTRFAPGEFVRTTASTRVLLPGADGVLRYLPYWGLAAELGLPSTTSRTVPPEALSGYRDGGNVSLAVRCGDRTGFAADGTITPFTAAAFEGTAVMELDAATCATLAFNAGEPRAKVFVQGVGQNPVYILERGQYRHVTSGSLLTELGGGSRPPVLRVSGGVMDRLPKGEPLRAAPTPAPTPQAPVAEVDPAQMVRSSSSPRTYMSTADGRALYLSSWELGEEWGFTRSDLRVIDDATFGRLSTEGNLSLFATCGGEPVFASRGNLYRIDSGATSGFALAALDGATCDLLGVSSAATMNRVFVQPIGQSAVYVADNGVFRHVTSPSALAALGGGSRPPVLSVSAAMMARLPIGSPWA